MLRLVQLDQLGHTSDRSALFLSLGLFFPLPRAKAEMTCSLVQVVDRLHIRPSLCSFLNRKRYQSIPFNMSMLMILRYYGI